ncbi:uncharacterized protein TNCV_1332091 [Trichonephila clavipes]|nr:uncharacterized protein TNCV_1332091 [Trichonephila clavipes]
MQLGSTSAIRYLERGCPQGSVSGPIFWNIIINDLLSKLNNLACCEIIAFADDILVCSQGRDISETFLHAQEALNFASDWSKSFKLEFNPDKTRFMAIENRNVCYVAFQLYLDGTPLTMIKECEPLYSPTEIDKEIEAVEQYFDKIVTWRFRAKKQLRKNNKFKSDSDSCKTTEESKLIEPMKGLLGSALATVEGFAITAENYAKAVEILKDRFGRKDAIINCHMQKLLSVTPLKRSDDTKVLRQFFDMCQTQIRSLESLDVSFESFSNVLCPLILNCLPSDLVLEFNKETDGSEGRHNRKFANRRRGQTFKGRISGCKHTFRLDSYGKNENGKGKAFQCFLSLHVSDNCIKDLWSLDVLGIKDPFEKKTRIELEEAAKDHFARHVTRDADGRYVVSLPWIQERSKNLGKYEAVFHSWQNEDIIEEVQNVADKKNEHYLLHHPVYKDNSTTKIRPVFDGSAKEKNSSSINECLEKGPNMIGLQEKDRPFLRFLWWDNGDKEKTKIYQHKRVVFGITSSPFLLGATLEYHLKQVSVHLQLTAQKLLESFYVDNCLTSVDNAEDIERFMLESKEILSLKFNLRGWVHTGVSEAEKGTLLEEEKKVPVLGLISKPYKDTLSVDWEENSKINEIPVTKRKILSAVRRIFDPIRFTCPVTLEPKILLQEYWKLGVSWDTELPLSISRKFERWKEHLKCLNNLEIPRCISKELSPNSDLSLHVFCDASKAAYASCVILRTEVGGAITCQLVQARARVASIKPITIPKLELLACTIGSRLINTTKIDLVLDNVLIYYWSDSVNALYWIKRKENWGTFVNNRVQEIRRLTNPEDWKHIPGILNPADLPSRGCGVVELIASLWWEGQVGKQRNDRDFGELITQETDAAERKVLKIVQKQSFSNDTKSLVSQMQTLVDSDGIIRIKSKIIMRKDVESIRYPIVLPSRHPIVTKLVIQKHIELLHAGVQTVMSALRENYWILKSRKTVRRVLSECIICKRFTVRPLTTISPPLPEDRFFTQYIWNSLPLCLPRASYSLSEDLFHVRGRPFTIYSDNGKNLFGTSNELKNIDWKKVKDYGSLKKISWKLNPPSSPWWGDFWEWLIGMLKIILRRVLGKACLTYEELLYCSMRL